MKKILFLIFALFFLLNFTISHAADLNLKATNSETGISLSWEAIPNATSYQVFKEGELITSISKSPYSDLDVKAGATYTYRVTALDKDGDVLDSNTASITRTGGTSPSPSTSPKTSPGISPTPTPSPTQPSITIDTIGTIIFPTTTVHSMEEIVVRVIDWLLALAGGLAVIAIVYSGVMYITSGGDPTKAETAKKNLIWAIIGVVVVALSLVIINTITTVIK